MLQPLLVRMVNDMYNIDYCIFHHNMRIQKMMKTKKMMEKTIIKLGRYSVLFILMPSTIWRCKYGI